MAKTETHEDKDVVLEKYELGYHLVPSLGEDDLALRVAELEKAIEKAGGTILSQGKPTSFILAYTIRRLRGGRWEKYDTSFFGWIRCEVPAAHVPKLRETLDHSEHIVRYIILKLDAAAFAPAFTPRREVVEGGEVAVEPKALVKRQDVEESGDVSEEELDKQIDKLIS